MALIDDWHGLSRSGAYLPNLQYSQSLAASRRHTRDMRKMRASRRVSSCGQCGRQRAMLLRHGRTNTYMHAFGLPDIPLLLAVWT